MGPKTGSDDTTSHQRAIAPLDPSTSYSLTVLEGPDAGLRVALDGLAGGPVLVGKGPACVVRLSDAEVSRRHVSLESGERGLRMADLGSTNGTFVDGVEILEALLHGGERVRIGATVLQIDARPSLPQPGRERTESSFGGLLGASAVMRRLYPLCRKLAMSMVPVVIEGETGTGKEVLAEALHEQGPRSAGPFIVFDCTAVPPNLVEAELFGHERGAFTGALATRKGVFELAEGGTLLIDEIGDLDLALQPKLLRAIERCEVRRVGSAQSIRVDVRLLAATRRDLDREVQSGRFRDDLFHRFTVARIELPPLRKRTGDVERLAAHFFRTLDPSAPAPSSTLLSKWRDYGWPGNVRELRNAVARQLALGELAHQDATVPEDDETRTIEHDIVKDVLALDLPLSLARQRVIDEFERRYVARVLDRHGGNVVQAARASGIARRYLQKLKARQSR